MSPKESVISFFRGVGSTFGSLGNGWYPSGALDGVGPFRSTNSDAGVIVDPNRAMQLAAVFACVRLISETVATLPLELKQPGPDGKLQLATASRQYQMLSSSPNLNMTAVEFWEMMVASLCLWGNAYAQKIRIGGRVASLDPLRPEYMTVLRNNQGQIQYSYAGANGQANVIFNAEDILHIKNFGVDGLVGMSPIQQGRQTVGRSIATDMASGKIFMSGMTASGYLTVAGALTKEQREMMTANLQTFSGSGNTGKTMVLENGMTYKGISINPSDAQLLESRYFNVEEVCRWYGVPPSLVGYVTKASSWASSLENTTLGWLKYGLRAYLVRIEQALTRSLALPSTTVLKFNLRELQRGDTAAQSAMYASGAQNGYMTRNRILDDMGEPRSDEDNADALTVQSNLVPLAKLGAAAPAPAPADPPVETEPKP